MTGLQLNVGLFSGINYVDLVKSLIEVDGEPMRRLSIRTERLAMERNALTEMRTRFLTTAFPIRRLNSLQPYLRTDVTSSNPSLMTASRSGGTAVPGSYTFTPLQMASSQQTVARGVASDSAALGRTGTVTLGRAWSVENDVTLNNINGGEGFTRGLIRLTDGNGIRATIDLRQAFTVRDVIDAINDNYDIDIVAELDNDRIVLRDVSGGDPTRMMVQEVSGGGTAASLGLLGRTVDANGVLTGDVIWRLSENMNLSQLNDGNGLVFDNLLTDLSIITRDGSRIRVDFSRRALEPEIEAGAPVNARELTIGDLLRTINETPCDNNQLNKVHARISDCGKRIVIEDRTTGSGITTISQAGTNPVFRYLGLTSDTTTTTIDMLSGLTENGNTVKMSFTDKAGNTAIIEFNSADISIIQDVGRNPPPTVPPIGGMEAMCGLIADELTHKLRAAGVELEVRWNKSRNALYVLDHSNGTGTLSIQDVGTDFLARMGLANIQESETVAMLAAATPGTLRLTDQTGKNVDIGITRGELDAIKTADDLLALFEKKLEGLDIGIEVALNEAGTGVVFKDTTGGTASRMMITDSGGGDIALRLGLRTTKSTGDMASMIEAITAGKISVTDQHGKTAIIDIDPEHFEGVTQVSGLAIRFNELFEAAGVEVELLAVPNFPNDPLSTSLIIRAKNAGGSTAVINFEDVAGEESNIMSLLGLKSKQTTVTTFLGNVTPGKMRFIDQDGNHADIEFSKDELNAVSSMDELATLFNDKLAEANEDRSNAEKVKIEVSLNAHGTGLVFTDKTDGGTASPMQILDVVGSGSNFASQLGFTNPFRSVFATRPTTDIRFSDQAGNHTDIRITSAEWNNLTSIQDLAALFNKKLEDTGVGVSVELDPTGTRLTFSDTTGETGHQMSVVDVTNPKNSGMTWFETNVVESGRMRGITLNVIPGDIELTDKNGNSATLGITAEDLDKLKIFGDLVTLFNDKIAAFNAENPGDELGIEALLNADGSRLIFRDISGGTGSMTVKDADPVSNLNILHWIGFRESDNTSTTTGNELRTFDADPLTESNPLVPTTGSSRETNEIEVQTYESEALINHMAESNAVAIQGSIQGTAVTQGTFETRNLLGGLDTVLMATLNGGFGLSQARAGGAIEVQDRAGNKANLTFSQADLNSMHTLSDSVKIINKKLSDAGVKMTVRINDQKTGLQVVDNSGSSSHNLIFRDLVISTTIPGTPAVPAVPEVPAVNAVSGSTGTNAVSNGEGTARLSFGKTSLLNGFTFAFTNDPSEESYDATDKKFTFYLDADAIYAETDVAVRNQMVKAAIDSLIAEKWEEIYPPATHGTIPPPEVALSETLADDALADALTGEETAITTASGGTLGKPEATASLTFAGTHWMNNFTFGFTTNFDEAGYDTTTQKFTFAISQDALDALSTDADRDTMVRFAINAQIESVWTSIFPESIFGGVVPPTLQASSGLAARALNDSASGAETAIKANVDGAVMGVTHVPEVPEVPAGPDTVASANPSIASSFGLNVNTASSQASGGSLQRQFISFNTPLSELNGGAGVNMLGANIVISDSSDAFSAANPATNTPARHLGTTTIMLDSSIRTVGELIEFINLRMISTKVLAKINDTGDGIVFEEFAGGSRTFSIYDADSTSRFASSLGIAGSVSTSQRDSDGRARLGMSETHHIEVEASDSLDDIRKKINDLNIGYAASILVDGSDAPYRLSVSGKQTGAAGAFNLDLSAIGLTSETMSKAKDAMLVYGDSSQSTGLILRSATNTFNGVIHGINLTITGTSNTPVTITNARSNIDILVAIEAFVDGYNKFRTQLNDDMYFEVSAAGVEGNILHNCSVAKAFDREITKMLQQTISGIQGIRSLADLGITMRSNFHDESVNPETNTLIFDKEKFEEVWLRDPEGIQKFFFDEREYINSDGTTRKENVGWAQKFVDVANTLVGDGALLGKTQARLDSLEIQIDRNSDRVAFMEERLKFKEQMYLKQFYAMEQAMARMTTDMASISNMMASWSNG